MIKFISAIISQGIVQIFLLSLTVALGVAFERYAFASFVFCLFTWLTICNVGSVIMRRNSDEIQ